MFVPITLNVQCPPSPPGPTRIPELSFETSCLGDWDDVNIINGGKSGNLKEVNTNCIKICLNHGKLYLKLPHNTTSLSSYVCLCCDIKQVCTNYKRP